MTADLVAAVQAAREHIVAAGTARFRCVRNRSLSLPDVPANPKHGPVRRLVRHVGDTTGLKIFRMASRGNAFYHSVGEGVIDLTGRRSMTDHGGLAELQIGNQQWGGRSGRAVDTLLGVPAQPPAEPGPPPSPLWLVDLLGGITTAEDRGVEDVDGRRCRRIAATADLIDASSRTPDGLPSPARDRVEELLSLPIEVWLDADDLRQIRFVDGDFVQSVTLTVTFSDFGADLDEIDWSRLPTFNTPQR